MTQIKDVPVVGTVPAGGYVLLTEPGTNPSDSIFAKVSIADLATAVAAALTPPSQVTATETAQPVLNRTYQRDTTTGGPFNLGVGAVSISVTLSGAATLVQYRLRDATSLITLVDWTSLGAGVSGGNTYTPNLPAGPNRYFIDVRANSGGPALGTQAFGVGEVIVALGQDLASTMLVPNGDTTTNATLSVVPSTHSTVYGAHSDSTPVWAFPGDSTPYNSTFATKFGGDLETMLGVVVGFVCYGYDAQPISFYGSGNTALTNLLSAVEKWRIFIWNHGQADAAGTSQANYLSALTTLLSRMDAINTFSGPKLKLLQPIPNVAATTAIPGTLAIRAAMTQYAAANASTTAIQIQNDLNLVGDGVHTSQAGEIRHVIHTVRAIRKLLGISANSDQGPTITSATRATGSAVINVTVAHAVGGTDLVALGAPSTVFKVFNSGTVSSALGIAGVARSSPTTFQITLSSVPSDTQALGLWCGYGYQAADQAANGLWDNYVADGYPIGRHVAVTLAETVVSAPGVAAPGTPSISAAAVSSSSIALTLTKGTVGLPVSYTVQRSTAADFSAALVTVNGGAPITYTSSPQGYADAGLTAGTLYYYRASATNTGGTSANSTAASATTNTGGGSTYLTSLPTIGAASGGPIVAFDASKLTGADGSAVASAPDQSVSGLTFTQATSGNRPTLHAAGVNGLNTLRITTGQSLSVSAAGALAGLNASDLTILVVTTSRSTAGAGSQHQVFSVGAAATEDGVFLWDSWNNSIDTLFGRKSGGSFVWVPDRTGANATAVNVVGKHVCRYTASSGLIRHYTTGAESTGTQAANSIPWSIVNIGDGSPIDCDFCEVVVWKGLATDAERDAIYTYANVKWDTAGTGTQSLPGAPTSVTVGAGNAQNVVFPAVVSASPSVTGYNIYRGTTAGGESGTPIANNVSIPYVDAGLTNGTTYYYRAAAVNSVGVGPLSPESSGTPIVTTDPGPPIPTASSPYGVYFSSTYYLTNNPDVAAAGLDPLGHYNQFGWKEGRDPSQYFSTNLFLAAYPTVAAAQVNPLAYFVSTGYALGERAIPPPPLPPPPPATPLPTYGSAPALTGIVWTQPMPVHPSATFGAFVGFATPVGGVGPYSWGSNLAVGDNSKYGIQDRNGVGEVSSPWSPFGTTTDVLTIGCTDARGVTINTDVTIQKTSAGTSPVWMLNERNPTSNIWLDAYNQGPLMRAHFVDAAGNQYRGGDGGGWTLQIKQLDGTPSPFQWEYDDIRWKGPGTRVPAGNYPMQFVYTNSDPTVAPYLPPLYTLVVRDPPAPITVCEFKIGTVSTSTLAGTYVGTINATTPGNHPTFQLSDDAGLLVIDPNTRRVTLTKQPTATGTVNGIIIVNDGAVGTRFSFSFPVVAGVTLSPSLLTFTQASGLDNAANNQTLGQITVDPSVTFAGTKQYAITAQTRLCTNAVTFLNPVRIAVTNTGSVINAPRPDGISKMSEGFDDFTVTVTDGLTTVTNTFRVNIARCANVVNYYVGGGNPATRGSGVPTTATKLATYEQFRGACMNDHPTTFLQFYIDDDADPYVYVNGNTRTQDFNLRYAFAGPGAITWIGRQSPGASEPATYFGGDASNGPGGGDMRGKGCLVMGAGDWTLTGVPVRNTHGPTSLVLGLEGIRKDGETPGDLTLIGVSIARCDNGFEAGEAHGIMTVDRCVLSEGGTSHVFGGPCHNIYCGSVWKFVMTNCKSRGATLGHLVKSRAQISIVTDNELFDGLTGDSSCCADFPNGGQVTFDRNYVEKGAMAQNPYAVQYAAEGVKFDVNTFSATGNTVAVMTLDGNHFGSPAGFGIFNQLSRNGDPVLATIANTQYYYAPNSNAGPRLAVLGNTSDAGLLNLYVTQTGTTVLTEPPVFNIAQPWYSGNLPPKQALSFHGLWGNDYYQGFEGVQHVADREQIVVHKTDSSGTVLVRASGAIDTLFGNTNPFGAGTTASLVHIPNYYPEFIAGDPWAPDNWFTLSTDGAGLTTVSLAVPASTINKSVSQFQLKLTASNGTFAITRYSIKVIT